MLIATVGVVPFALAMTYVFFQRVGVRPVRIIVVTSPNLIAILQFNVVWKPVHVVKAKAAVSYRGLKLLLLEESKKSRR